MKTQVLIIGAGPTGLMLANQLQRLDVSFEILDLKTGPTEESRALAVTARSMELYQQLGLSDTVQEQAVELSGFRLFLNGKAKAQVEFRQSGTGFSDFPNFMNAFEQSKNEKLLTENLEKQGKTVLWQHKFISLKQTENGVVTTVKNTVTNEEIIIESDYIVGCDGASSPIRKSQNMSFKGGTYENKFFVVDATIEWDLDYDRVILSPTDKLLIVFFPLLGNKTIRIIGTLPKQFGDQEDIDFEVLEKIIVRETKLNIDIVKVGWYSIYKLHHRCVDDFRSGRVFLAGDSAHIHSPAGGQGMNTGLQDAHNLAWKLALVLKGKATKELLDTYTEERLPFAKVLLKTTDRGFTMLADSSYLITRIRKYILIPTMSRIMNNLRFRRFAFQRVAQIKYGYRKSSLSVHRSRQRLKFKAGDRLSYVRKGYYIQFSDPVFYLICLSDGTQNMDLSFVGSMFPFEVRIVEEVLTDDWRAFGVTDTLFILLRPDHYLLGVADRLEDLQGMFKWQQSTD